MINDIKRTTNTSNKMHKKYIKLALAKVSVQYKMRRVLNILVSPSSNHK